MHSNSVNAADTKPAPPLSVRLNQIARCMRRAENTGQWIQSVMDGTSGFCGRAAFFAVDGKALVCKAARGLNIVTDAVPMVAAPAFASAVESQDTVVAMRTAGEMSKTISEAFAGVTLDSQASLAKVHLIPLTGAKRSLAVLYAEDVIDLDALELLMSIAASAREHIHAVSPQSFAKFVGIEPADAGPDAARARRFAQALVSRIRLDYPELVLAGRTEENIYSQLKPEIEAACASYQQQFGKLALADYMHLELVRILANEDASKLGTVYPGPAA